MLRQKPYLFLVVMLALSLLTPALGQRVSSGVVVWPTRSGCDYFIVSSNLGYAVLQLFLGSVREPESFDNITGEFERFGFKDVTNVTKRVQYRVWVEDF